MVAWLRGRSRIRAGRDDHCDRVLYHPLPGTNVTPPGGYAHVSPSTGRGPLLLTARTFPYARRWAARWFLPVWFACMTGTRLAGLAFHEEPLLFDAHLY